MHSFTGHVVFCEDIRIEENRQVSYIGVFPFHRAQFDPIEEDEFVLPKFGLGIYLDIPSEYEGHSPYIRVISIDKDEAETTITDKTLSEIPHSKDGKVVHGVSHIQLEGLVAAIGTKFAVDVTIKNETRRIGQFQTFKRKEDINKENSDNS